MTTSQPSTRRLVLPRALAVAIALGGSLLAVALSYGTIPSWLAIVPAMYLVFASPGIVAVLCLGPRQRGFALVLVIVTTSLFAVMICAVALDLISIKITGRSLAVADLCTQLLITAGCYLWRVSRGDEAFWLDDLGLGSVRGLVPRHSWLPGVLAGISIVVLIGAVVVATRQQHPQRGVPFSSLEFVRGDAALDGELSLRPAQQVAIPLELDTAAGIDTADITTTVDAAAAAPAQLHRVDTGKLTGKLTLTAPAQAGRVQVVISTVNPTYVASATVTNPATANGAAAEEVDSAPLLELVLWVDVA